MKTSRQAIENFLSAKKIAIAGVSRDTRKFGYTVFKELSDRGFDIYPVNPNTDTLGGIPCFKNVGNLPNDVRNLLIVTPKPETAGIVAEAVDKGITSIWIQQMSETPEALRLAEAGKAKLIWKECILMWTEPVRGVHKFHRSVKKLFGMLPK